jgi:hypothetical protein
MLSDDAYKTKLRATIASLEAWFDDLRQVAAIETSGDEVSWGAVVNPHAAGSCAFELLLRTDQCFDLSVGRETYEDQPIENLATFQPLLAAIASGRVITRTWRTPATETTIRVETIIAPEGNRWIGARNLLHLRTTSPDSLLKSDRHYAPYARAA